MSRPLKRVLIGFGALMVALLIGFAYLSTLISPAKLTQMLVLEVREATGRELSITGPVRLGFFPRIAVSAEQVSLSNAAWAKKPQMASLEKVALEISLLPLLSGRIEVSSIQLAGLTLNLETNAKGEGNWLMSGVASPNGATVSPSTDTDTADRNTVLIENLNLTNGQIYYQPSGAAVSSYGISRLSLQKSGSDTVINADLKQNAFTLALKGKMTSIREVLRSIGTEAIDVNFDFEVTLGGKASQLKGKAALNPAKPTQFDVSFKAGELDLSAIPAFSSPASPTTSVASNANTTATKVFNTIAPPSQTRTAARAAERFFSDTPLPLDYLPSGNGTLNVDIAQLVLPSKVVLKKVVTLVRLSPQQMDIPKMAFQLGNGQFDGSARIGNTQTSPNWAFKGQASGFTLEQLLASTNSKGKVSGGDMHAAFNFTSSGMSPNQIASGLSGQSQITIGSARLASSFMNQGGDVLISLFDAINPMRKKTNETTLECAVAYLPVKNGVVTVRDSIGVETDRLNIVLAGSVNLNSEQINLAFYPKEKSGLTAGLDLASLVRLQGSLVKPQVGINKEAAVSQALTLGLGFLTGGASIVAQNAEGVMNKPHPCRTAMHSWDRI
ncbi:AsmA family protein [Polynucleobacter difficilis]|uniref:AsmA family protein n=1 Tax=Polynucleobacter difficilis TaxID=556054 RepID=UPI00131EE847|nr:AsmA family protein [Polynucleobacter difficilis]